jgi:RHS repeat-associated protein
MLQFHNCRLNYCVRFFLITCFFLVSKTTVAQTATAQQRAQGQYITELIKNESRERREAAGNNTAYEDPKSPFIIDGPDKVELNSQQSYHISPLLPLGYYWYVSCGTVKGFGDDMLTIIFDHNCATCTIMVFDSDDKLVAKYLIIIANGVDSLSAGNIVTGDQVVDYDAVPASLSATAAEGGSCNGSYQYQWQFSYDDNIYQDIDSAFSESLEIVQYITRPTFFRRRVVCATDTLYTARVAIMLTPVFEPGKITSANQQIDSTVYPAQITASDPQNCSGSVMYNWQISTDAFNFSDIGGATNPSLNYGGLVHQTTYFRRKATCNNETKYTNVCVVSLKPPVFVQAHLNNEIDSLLQSAGVNLASLFHLQSDSLANNRRSVNSEYQFKDSIDFINQQISPELHGYATLDSAAFHFIDTLAATGNLDSLIARSSFGGVGSDTANVFFIPVISDSTLQAMRSIGNFSGLDSLISLNSQISEDEIIQRLQEDLPSIPGQQGFGIFPSGGGLFIQSLQRGAVINGPTVVPYYSTTHYTASFYFPINQNPDIHWIVYGGTITSQNINPANGPIYVNVTWNSAFGVPYVAVVDITTKQFNTLEITFASAGCYTFPALQTIYYGQVPCVLMATSCAKLGSATENYQWQVLDVYSSNSNWTDISGANNATYQPPAFMSGWLMYRRVTNYFDASNTVIASYTSNPASVRLMPVNGGVISAPTYSIQYNTSPAISNTAATGGYIAYGGPYTYTWESSTDGTNWQTISTGVNFPGLNVIQNGTRIRRKAEISNAMSLGLPQNLYKNYSNILVFSSYYQTTDYENRNYIRENIVQTRGINTWEDADLLTSDKKIRTTVYLDGISRPIQTVGKGTHYDEQTGQWWDLVQPVTYEAGGRIDKSVLAYPSTENFGKYKNNTATDQPAYYVANFGDTHAYSKVDYDNSPLNQPLKAYAPGDSWAGNNVGTEAKFEPYNSSEGVRQWSIGFGLTDLPVTHGIYSDLYLIKQKGTDEKGKNVITYTERNGNIILKKVQLYDDNQANFSSGWLWTYYVYDDLGHLRYTITPKAVAELEGSNWVMNTTIAAELCFQYQYDELGRAIIKKTPGKAAEYFVYDSRNRVVMSQDGNGRAKSPAEWHVVFYDELDRSVFAGLYRTAQTRTQLQQAADVVTGAQVINTTNGGAVSVWGAVLGSSTVNDNAVFTQLGFAYYDSYSYSGVKTFDATLPLAYKNGDVEAYEKTKRTTGMATGTKVKILKNNVVQYLISTVFYDEEGRSIQTKEDNINGGTEVAASQYHFDGRVTSTLQIHNNPNTVYTNLSILTKYSFDKIGRVIAVHKKINNINQSYSSSTSLPGSLEDQTGYKTTASYQFNELGRAVKKILSPQFNNGSGLETINYSYNIRGWLTGINQDYALGEYNSNQWDHFFGMYIGYDNRDGKFNSAQLNGQITGVQWKSQGDNTPRRFGYEYDDANRLTREHFDQRGSSTESWNHDKVDFSTYEGIIYDENGNLQFLGRMGIMPGHSGPIPIDGLNYAYQPQSNKLLRVSDGSGPWDGKLGDFKDGQNTQGTDDYEYDENGNIIKDENRAIKNNTGPGIEYNYMNKPSLIHIANKGTIEYLYDASGEKLQKVVTDNSQVASGGQIKITTTTYINSFIYESVTIGNAVGATELQFIAHEEGRIRVITPYNNSSDPSNVIGGGIDLPGGKQGVFDYYIKDQTQSIRVIITEEINKASSVCTMESADADVRQYEEALFGHPAANEVSATRYVHRTTGSSNIGWDSNTSNEVSKLQSFSGNTVVGPNVLLKVMAGDLISAKTDYYYKNDVASSANDGLSTLLQNLVGSLTSSNTTQVISESASGITTSLGNDPSLQGFFATLPFITSANPDAPGAFLTYFFFDEQFNFVGGSMVQVQVSGDGLHQLVATNLKAPKNGYVYVYLSNNGSEAVFFDNFAVSQVKSALIEESHYYAFGLKIASISSKAVASTLNPHGVSNGYQGSFSEEINDFDLNYNEFDLRTYDPQIGRWTGADPYDEFASPYVGMGNDPVSNVDPSGGFLGLNAIESLAFGAAAGAVVGGIFADATGGNVGQGMAIGALLGAGISQMQLTTLNGGLTTESSNFAINSSVNVAIYIYNKSEDQYVLRNSDGIDRFQWHIIVASDIVEARTKLDQYLKKKGEVAVDNLLLSSHGFSGGVEVSAGAIDDLGVDQIKAYNETKGMTDVEYREYLKGKKEDYLSNNLGDRGRVKSIESFLSIVNKITKGGNLVVTGCKAGNGAEGKEFGELLANGRNINVYLNQDGCTLVAFDISGIAAIAYSNGRLRKAVPIQGWRKFSYNVTSSKVEMIEGVKGHVYDVSIGVYSSQIPVEFKHYQSRKK